MRHLPLLGTSLLLLLLAPVARAQVKLGYVDLQRALNEVEDGKAAKAVLKKDFDEKQKQLNAKQAEFEKLRTDFEKQSVVMADQAKRERASELGRKEIELQQLFMQLQKDLSEREREVTRGIFDKMSGIVREIAEADGFTMIFERNDAGLVYAPPALDVTNELIRKYNARFPAGSAKKPAASAKPDGAKAPAAQAKPEAAQPKPDAQKADAAAKK